MTTVYESFADVVDEDYDPSLDGWDGQHPTSRATVTARLPAPPRFLMAAVGNLQPAPTIVVPHRLVGQGDEGPYVYAVKRGYARWKGGGRLARLETKPLAVRQRWGEPFSEEIGQDTYTKVLHTKLAPYFDAYALELARRATAMSKRDMQIAKQIAWLNALYNRRSQVRYSQARPSQLASADRITRADCSGSIAGSCDWADIIQEVDWRWTNTFVQIQFGRTVASISDAKPGDVFFYGSPSHEALYVGDGLVWSFGSYPIKILKWNYRSDFKTIRRFVPL